MEAATGDGHHGTKKGGGTSHSYRTQESAGDNVHAQCVVGEGYERVGVAGVSPPIAPKPEIKDVKGMCDVRRTPVFADQARSKNQRGAYVHAQCVHNVVQQPQRLSGVCVVCVCVV